jgi:hypothetical protein
VALGGGGGPGDGDHPPPPGPGTPGTGMRRLAAHPDRHREPRTG